MSDLQIFMERNQTFAAQYDGSDMSIMPKFSTLILTCIDARIDPAHFLGLDLGDALVFRNAGGRVTDDLELDIGVLWMMAARMAGDNFPGFSLALIQHTDCGYERLANPDLTAAMSNRLGVDQSTLDNLCNADHARQIRDDITRLRQSAVVPNGLIVSGHIYDVEHGVVAEVVAPTPLNC